MRRLLILSTVLGGLAFLFCPSLPAQDTVNVEFTFLVDMSVQIDLLGNFDPAVDTVFVSANFTEEGGAWECHGPGTDEDGDWIYEIKVFAESVPLGTGGFKYHTNCDTPGWESDPNRVYLVSGTEPDENGDGFLEVNIDVDFFNRISELVDIEVLFQVDMNAQMEVGAFDPNFDVVNVNPDFMGWDCVLDPLEDPDDDGIYELEVQLENAGITRYSFKYTLNCGGAWEGLVDNRFFDVTGFEPDEDADGFLDIGPQFYYWNDISDLGESQPVELIFRANMSVQTEIGAFDPMADRVVADGAFSNWGCDVDLVDVGGDIWEAVVQIDQAPPGNYDYAFVINCANWEQPNSVYSVDDTLVDSDGNGYKEIVLERFFNNVDVPPVLENVELIFRANMSVQIANGTFDPLIDFVRADGDFNIWGCDVDMADTGAGVYEATVQLTDVPRGTYNYNYVLAPDGVCTTWEAANSAYTIDDTQVDSDGDGFKEIVLERFWNDESAALETFKRGDSNANGTLDIGDPIINLGHQFLGDQVVCRDALDFNDSGTIDISDPVANLSHQFLGLAAPEAPGKAECGVDPTDDDPFECAAYPQENC